MGEERIAVIVERIAVLDEKIQHAQTLIISLQLKLKDTTDLEQTLMNLVATRHRLEEELRLIERRAGG